MATQHACTLLDTKKVSQVFNSWQEQRFFSHPQFPGWVWRLPDFHCAGYEG